MIATAAIVAGDATLLASIAWSIVSMRRWAKRVEQEALLLVEAIYAAKRVGDHEAVRVLELVTAAWMRRGNGHLTDGERAALRAFVPEADRVIAHA